MKKILPLFILFAWSLNLQAQPCLTNGITFSFQSEVDNFIIQYPNCTEIQGDVEIDGGSDITNLNGLSNITKIDGDLQIYDNIALTSLIGLEQLELITGDFDVINNGLINFTGLNNLNEVKGFVWIDSHTALENFEGLNNLIEVGDFFEIWDNLALTTLEGLENLEIIQGGFHLNFNPLLTNLKGLENLYSTGGRFVLNDHPQLENLDALINFRHIGETFRIQSCHNLTNLNGLNGLISVANNVRIFNNTQLQDCSINILCNTWAIGGDIDIFNNAIGCMDTLEIFNKCQEGISGTMYYDFNQNQQRDSFEGGIPMMEINISPNNSRTFSNQNGKYFFTAQEGVSYDFEPSNNSDWALTTLPSSFAINYTSGNPDNQNNDFGFSPNFSNHNFSIDQFSNNTRCNSEADFFITSKNIGTFLEENGKIEIEFDELYSYVDAFPSPQNIDLTNRILTWNYNDLYPFQHHQIQITFGMPDETFTGATTQLNTSIFRDSLGQLVEIVTENYQSIIRCSYDPNDKLVFPEGAQEEKFTPKDIPLEYTIRFQNTGNDYAWDIAIRDTLDSDLDFTTFEVLYASHDLQTTISENGAINFLFENIFLPDSTTDFVGSQGLVKYRIHPKLGLDDFTVVENTAHIYFDANPAIVTNTTINTLVDEIPVFTNEIKEEIEMKIFPNPTNDYLNIEVSNLTNLGNYELEIWSSIGQKLISKQFLTKQIQVNYLPEGFYFLGLKNIKTNQVDSTTKFVIER